MYYNNNFVMVRTGYTSRCGSPVAGDIDIYIYISLGRHGGTDMSTGMQYELLKRKGKIRPKLLSFSQCLVCECVCSVLLWFKEKNRLDKEKKQRQDTTAKAWAFNDAGDTVPQRVATSIVQ